MPRNSLLTGLFAVLLLALACGCTDDLRRHNLFDTGAGEAIIRFAVENISLTRSEEGEDLENRIKDAYLLFYPAEVSVQTATPIAAVKATVSDSNPAALIFKMPLSLEPDTEYQLLAIANADGFVPEGYGSFAEYLQAWSALGLNERGDLLLKRADPMLAEDIDCLPMRGGTSNGMPFSYTMQNGVYSVSASLKFRRAVARIDVANMVKEGFTVEGVALCNWRDSASAASEEGELGNRLGAVRGILTDENADEAEFVAMPAPGDDGIQQLTSSLYSFPSTSYDSHSSDMESTALIIKARYGEDAQATYYRVNVGVSGNRAEVKANTKYLVAIQSVKGSGASTAVDAYSSGESQLVLSVVEDWDLEGSFAMDDNGNFIVLSTGRLEFTGDSEEKRIVKVLTSKGLNWTVGYTADDEASSAAFTVSELSASSLAIGPSSRNTGDKTLSGKFTVSAQTAQGETLAVDILVVQTPAEGGSEDPVIPDHMPFALIPESYERVKIDHKAKTIEIDGFDPDCFNSFIDVPFTVYIKDSSVPSVNISTTLEWPLEGRISSEKSSTYYYCQQSFEIEQEKKLSLFDGTLINSSEVGNETVTANNQEQIYISLGAMGPDDPAIIRDVDLIAPNGAEVKYNLKIKPCPVIIDDVIIHDESENYWLVQDRNIQDYLCSNINMREYIGLDSQGRKYQAYNYSQLMINVNSVDVGLQIPFKFNADNSIMSEKQHQLYQGIARKYGERTDFSWNSDNTVSRLNWLKKYSYTEGMERHSPFYESDEGQYCYDKWNFPTQSVLELIGRFIRVSKMRMYLMSEIPVEEKGNQIFVCCYIPYKYKSLDDVGADNVFGYFTSEDGKDPDKIILISFSQSEGILRPMQANSKRIALSRLVRPLTQDELQYYKENYLGYGSQPHRLTICHPDTYESTSLGWIPF